MEKHLEGRDWLAADHATIADVAIYAYTAHAPEGGASIDGYPRLRAWLSRVEALPGFVAMMPVEAVRSADPVKLAACAGAAVTYAGLAWLVFEQGLKRYTSGSRILELR